MNMFFNLSLLSLHKYTRWPNKYIVVYLAVSHYLQRKMSAKLFLRRFSIPRHQSYPSSRHAWLLITSNFLLRLSLFLRIKEYQRKTKFIKFPLKMRNSRFARRLASTHSSTECFGIATNSVKIMKPGTLLRRDGLNMKHTLSYDLFS